jgi:hypothetical protein
MNQAHEYGVHEGQLREWEQGVGKMAITTAAGIDAGRNRSGVQGVHLDPLGLFLNPLGLFLRTSTPSI